MAQSCGIPTKFTRRVIKEGWKLKPKGSLQILFERGWINPLYMSHYSAKGKGSTDTASYSIDLLMQKQEDFTSEMTLLQYHASLMGVTIERSPKCHPEIAGEGVEYGWALSKIEYRRSPIAEKRTKDGFLKLVRKCMNNQTILNLKQMRSCSRRACQYMLLYKAVESLNLNGSDGILDTDVLNKHSILEGSIKLFRKLKKTKQSHRCVLENQVADTHDMERDCPLDGCKEESKENIIKCVVGKMVTL